MKILHVIRDLGDTGAAKQLTLLGRGLAGGSCDVQVCALGREAGNAPLLRRAGVPVHLLSRRHGLDLATSWQLGRLIRSIRPKVIHAWGAGALGHVTAARGKCPVVVHFPLRTPRLSRASRWLLSRATRIVARTQAEATRLVRCQVPPYRVALVPPAVDNSLWQTPSPRAELPESARLIVCAGPLERSRGFRDAAWALDVLLFLFPDLHLAIAGTGPERGRLETFTHRNDLSDRIHFLGARADVPALLARADLVWVPSLCDTGGSLALEALAAGRAVVASDMPGLREVVSEGQTGFLVPPGDKIARSRRTRELLCDRELARRMGEAGRRHAALFSPAKLVERCTRLYEEVAA